MAITVELPPEIEQQFLAQARARGISVDAYVQEYLMRSCQLSADRPTLSVEEVDRILDEAADLVPAGVAPLSDEAMSRENIYIREND
jgi:hypothetical protein